MNFTRYRLLLLVLFSASLIACGGQDNSAELPADEGALMSEGFEMSNASEKARLTGTVSYRERIALRMDAVVTVRLSDVSLQDAPARLIDEQQIEARGKSVPIPYVLEYDPGLIDERYSYAVRAEIRDGAGQLLWTTDTMIPVLTRGSPADEVDIMLVRASN